MRTLKLVSNIVKKDEESPIDDLCDSWCHRGGGFTLREDMKMT